MVQSRAFDTAMHRMLCDEPILGGESGAARGRASGGSRPIRDNAVQRAGVHIALAILTEVRTNLVDRVAWELGAGALLVAFSARCSADTPLLPSADLAVDRAGTFVASLRLLERWAVGATMSASSKHRTSTRLHAIEASLGAFGPFRPCCDLTVDRAVVNVARLALDKIWARLAFVIGLTGNRAAASASTGATCGGARRVLLPSRNGTINRAGLCCAALVLVDSGADLCEDPMALGGVVPDVGGVVVVSMPTVGRELGPLPPAFATGAGARCPGCEW